MLLRRVVANIEAQNWTAVGIDFLIVVIGVFVGIQVSNWNTSHLEARSTVQLIQALREDVRDALAVEEEFLAEVDAGLAAFDAARERGETPPPYVFRIPGSDTPPRYTWQAAQQSRLAELVHPNLLFELAFYYSERDGIGVKYERYAIFVENEVLPRLKEDPAVFYNADRSRLLPVFEANMDRLREWSTFVAGTRDWGHCLHRRFAEPLVARESCRPHFIVGGSVDLRYRSP
jgi:hypothetical protein